MEGVLDKGKFITQFWQNPSYSSFRQRTERPIFF
jgi:hypothetical protein